MSQNFAILSNVITAKEKERVITKYRLHSTDTGSAEVQIAILSEEVNRLTLHLKQHPKDHHSRRGLLSMVMRRKRLLDWLKKENVRRYNSLNKKLGLKK